MLRHATRNFRGNISFRDHLRTHPTDANSYASLKRELVRKFLPQPLFFEFPSCSQRNCEASGRVLYPAACVSTAGAVAAFAFELVLGEAPEAERPSHGNADDLPPEIIPA